MMRVSIRPYLHDWVIQIGQQMGCEDATEVVNHLLREHKRLIAQQPTVADSTTVSNPSPNSSLVDVLSNEFGVWQ
jgi:hypothetical protein